MKELLYSESLLNAVTTIGALVNAIIVSFFTLYVWRGEIIERKKAKLRIISTKGFITILNVGKAEAKNIKAEITNKGHNLILFDTKKLEGEYLRENESIDLPAGYASQISVSPVIMVTWDDEFKKGNTISKIIHS